MKNIYAIFCCAICLYQILSDKGNKDLYILIQQLLQDIHYAPDHSVNVPA